MIEQPLSPEAREEAERAAIEASFKFPWRGPMDAPILVICDHPTMDAARNALPMELDLHRMFAKMALRHGFKEGDFLFVGLCPPVPPEFTTDAKMWNYIKPYAEQVREIITNVNPQMIVPLGKFAARLCMGRSVKIMKARGMCHHGKDLVQPVMPFLPTGLVRMQPDNVPIMNADLSILSRLKAANYNPDTLIVTDVNYRWCNDLSDLIANPPKALAVDTETTGLDYRAPDFEVICAQISTGPGDARVIRLSPNYFPNHTLFENDDVDLLRAQFKTLMEDHTIKKIGHNLKYDHGAIRRLGIEVCGWEYDTELLGRIVAENFFQYSLDELVRIYVPELAGYADHFNQTIDKSKMMEVPPVDETDLAGGVTKLGMLAYAGGDPDATYRLFRALYPMAAKEPGQLHIYQRLQMPALLAFAKRIETYGQGLNVDALHEFETEVGEFVEVQTRKLIRLAPAKVKRKYTGDPKGFKLSRADVLKDILFSPEGFALKPKVWTKSTQRLPMEQRVPSVSAKDHLPYFKDLKGPAGTYCTELIDLVKAEKMLTTYVRGFYKYVKGEVDGMPSIFPEYNFRTNTFRTNSASPNGQNFPKRSKFAKNFLKLIKARPGKILIAADLSQIELRIAAWMANEKNMLKIYQMDGDIHASTAAMVMGITIEEFRALAVEVYKLKRFQAKAINFGYIFGAREKTFVQVAKTDYGIDYTIKEATDIRNKFFGQFPGLEPWHDQQKYFAHEHGIIQSLHGGTRHLPSIYSPEWSIMAEAERQAINAPVQRFGSDLGVMAIIRLAAQCDPNVMRPIGFVHDQIICECDPDMAGEAMGWLVWVMENPMLEKMFGIRAPLPIRAEAEFGYSLAETEEVPRADLDIIKPDWWEDNEEEKWIEFTRETAVPELVFATA